MTNYNNAAQENGGWFEIPIITQYDVEVAAGRDPYRSNLRTDYKAEPIPARK